MGVRQASSTTKRAQPGTCRILGFQGAGQHTIHLGIQCYQKHHLVVKCYQNRSVRCPPTQETCRGVHKWSLPSRSSQLRTAQAQVEFAPELHSILKGSFLQDSALSELDSRTLIQHRGELQLSVPIFRIQSLSLFFFFVIFQCVRKQMRTFALELQYIVTAHKSHTWEKGGPCLLFVSIEAGGAQRMGAGGWW